MSDDRWRTRLRWVVVHPHDPAVLLARRDGVLALPETERPGQVWTADPAEVLPALGELLGADALLLDCLDDHQDPAAGVQRATLLAVPREAPARPRGWPGWVGPAWPAPVPARPPWPPRVVEELERGPGGDGGQPWAARGWFAEAERWLRSTMERLGRPLTGPVRQARVWRPARAWELAAPLGALHQAVSYRSLAPGRRETPTWPSRPPGGSARCWPAWRDRRHRGTVPHGTAWPPPAAADCREMHRGKVGRWSWRRPRPHCRS